MTAVTDNERQLAVLLDYVDNLKEYIGILEEERDNYELLLKYLGAYDDSVDIHRFEDVVDKLQAYKVNCETFSVTEVTKNTVTFNVHYEDGTSETVSLPLPTPLVV